MTSVSLNGTIGTFLYTPFDAIFHPLQKIIKSILRSIESIKSIKERQSIKEICSQIHISSNTRKKLGLDQEYVSLVKYAV